MAEAAEAARAREERRAAVLEARAPVIGLRWATVLVGTLVGFTDPQQNRSALVVAVVLLALDAAWRTVQPMEIDRGVDILGLAVDTGICGVALVLTGGLNSPFVLAVMPTVLVTGQQTGYIGGLVSAGILAAIGGAVSVVTPEPATLRAGAQAIFLLGVTAAIGGLAHRLATSAESERRRVLGEVNRMRDANELLLALHGVAQTLPSSLDLTEVIASTRGRLRDLFDFEAATILVRDPTNGQWRVELSEGVRLPAAISDAELPTLLRPVVGAPMAIVMRDMLPLALAGCSPLSRSALVAPLRARGSVVGLLCIEHSEPDHYGPRDASILDELTEPLALAVDNAMWFGRLRTLGAEAERSRIARDLHDRTAQSLAYIAFELERIELARGGDDDIAALREVVRGVVTELRDTLFQLRAEIDDEVDLTAAASAYVPRWSERTGIAAEFTAAAGRRLAIPVEMEVWRILQECLSNVEKHSGAGHVDVRWSVGEHRAALEVRDDGRGFKPGAANRERYGLVGMRERADAIGAHLTVDSEPGAGTRVLVEVEVPT